MDRRDFLGSVGAAGMAASLAAVAAVAEARVSPSERISVAIMGSTDWECLDLRTPGMELVCVLVC